MYIHFLSCIKQHYNYFKLNLWGNKCDLSISSGQIIDQSSLFDVGSLDDHVLSDYSEDIWNVVSDVNASSAIIGKVLFFITVTFLMIFFVDFVLDNAGYELFTDLCVADYMISKKLCQSHRFYVKVMPWFISDVMTTDFNWLLNKLEELDDTNLNTLAQRWKAYVQEDIWKIVESDFWTLPLDFTYMSKVDPNLYKQLSEARAVFFKGECDLAGELSTCDCY